jgi:FKBP-type peptidyl-prolyl cis-trans isomerase FklB
MKLNPALLLLLPLAPAAWVLAQETLPDAASPAAEADPLAKAPPTDARHYSYAIGLDIGSSFKSDGLKFDVDSLLAGVRDGLAGADPKYSADLCGVAIQRLARERAELLLKRSDEFLAQNAKQEGVQTLPSGLQYKVLQAGSGAAPGPQSSVKVNYRGTLIDGTLFDATPPGQPATLPMTEVIPGWAEALQKMQVGAKWQLVIPPRLAYGPQGWGDGIPPNAALIYEIELLGVE